MSDNVGGSVEHIMMRVAWDMTHAGRIKTGTGVYARYLLDALEKEETVQAIPLAQPQAPAGRPGGVRKLAGGLRQIAPDPAESRMRARSLPANRPA